MKENSLYKIAITHGDINGIGYEVILKALRDNRILEICTPVIYGLTKVANYYKKAVDMNDFTFQIVKSPEQTVLKKANLINLSDNEVKIELGTSTKQAGKLSELSLNAACKDVGGNLVDALVTAPINKENIQSDSFKHEGHTEYLSHVFKTSKTLMMMVAEDVKVGFVTQHIPLERVSETITTDLILSKLKTLHHSLIHDFACTNPKIAVLSLNPHAGDKGLSGNEESEKIIPAINQAFEENINAFGPFPADGFFGAGKHRQFDAVLAMYHDQGMIPFKLLAMENGVNYTAGLPIVRTSPAHGTAYEIAGKNKASGDSFRSAIYLAVDILKNRNR